MTALLSAFVSGIEAAAPASFLSLKTTKHPVASASGMSKTVAYPIRWWFGKTEASKKRATHLFFYMYSITPVSCDKIDG